MLATAAALTALSLNHNTRLALTPADVDLLLRLPRLQQLALDGTATPATVLAELDRRAPRLAPAPSREEVAWFQPEGSDADSGEAASGDPDSGDARSGEVSSGDDEGDAQWPPELPGAWKPPGDSGGAASSSGYDADDEAAPSSSATPAALPRRQLAQQQ